MVRMLKWGAAAVAALVILILAWRVFDALREPHLARWHTFVPSEAAADEIARLDWAGYLAREKLLFDEVRAEVTDKLEPEDRVGSNRYFSGSPIYPGRFAQDWNRSYVMAPPGKPAGAVVLLHGLTDSPYSLRHVARRYVQDGFVALAIRLPGHGTVPSGLSHVEWKQWMAATHLAVREARRLAPAPAPLHVVGFSNGGALAVKYALDALDDPALARPERIVLFAPMIGITAMARFAGIFGWPAYLPTLDKAAWLGIVPEFNPFKYNSFPVNGARQSSLVARRLQAQIDRHATAGSLNALPPVLTFQSVVDFTVSTRAIVTALYAKLPDNGSELVLFDLNRNAKFGPLLRRDADTVLARLLPDPPRNFRTTVVTNVGPRSDQVLARTVEAGGTAETVRELGLAFPPGVFSLSHLALPFPLDDPLYGLQPDPSEDYGANLGAMAARGERGLLVVSIDSLARMSSNPFFAYVMERLDDAIANRPAGARP
ncbi:MAG: alpha/beta hydrolase [Burkholderiales bacterium]|nr:alpha/beta hydrolase [Burkholderiales bacterium]